MKIGRGAIERLRHAGVVFLGQPRARFLQHLFRLGHGGAGTTQYARAEPRDVGVFQLRLRARDQRRHFGDRALGLPGVVGIVLCSNLNGISLDDDRLGPVYEELSRRETTVFVHGNVPCSTEGLREYALALAMGFMADPLFAVGRLVYSGTIDRYPGINWIFSHLGGTVPFVLPRYDNYYKQFPECREKISRPPSEIIGELYFDTCTMHPPALRCAVDTLGAGIGEMVMFCQGSSARLAPGMKDAPVDAVIIGIVDSVDVLGKQIFSGKAA